MEELSTSIVITTKNRREELERALRSAFKQNASEILVIDDGSNDGTSDFVKHEFPSVTLVTHRESKGLVVRRNEGARIAKGEIIFSIDDDAEFSTDHIVNKSSKYFSDERVAAITLPFVDVKISSDWRQKAPTANEAWATGFFRGTAHAVRKCVFNNLGGYSEFLIHQGEEMDLCARMVGLGHLILMADTDPIYHYASVRRDLTRMDWYGRRNDILFAILNVPTIFLPLYLLVTTIRGCVWGIKVGRVGNMLRGLAAGYRDGFRFRHHRMPIKLRYFLLYRWLKQRPRRLKCVVERLRSM